MYHRTKNRAFSSITDHGPARQMAPKCRNRCRDSGLVQARGVLGLGSGRGCSTLGHASLPSPSDHFGADASCACHCRPRSAGVRRRRRPTDQRATGARVLVSDNPGCILHLRGAAHAARAPFEVRHFAQPLAERLCRPDGREDTRVRDRHTSSAVDRRHRRPVQSLALGERNQKWRGGTSIVRSSARRYPVHRHVRWGPWRRRSAAAAREVVAMTEVTAC